MYEWIETYAATLPNASLNYKVEWESMCFMLGDKSFGRIGTNKEGRPILTLKLPPDEGAMLRIVYPGQVVPGYYANKVHWNSFYLDGDLSEVLLKLVILQARDTLFATLPKKVQAALIK